MSNMIRVAVKIYIFREMVLFFYRWLRWLDWHRKDRKGLRVWQDVHAWFVYQIISGYPPGELHHWYDDAPPFLFHHWRTCIASLTQKERDEMWVRMGFGP